MNPSLIYSGQVLFIPAAFPGPVPPPLPRPVVYPGPVVHVVRWGETLYSLSAMYGVSTWAIAYANGLPNPNYIFAGQVLRIPAPMPVARPVMNPYPTWGSPGYPVPVPYSGYSGSPVAY
jgi:LysM repeat protein